MAFNIGKVKIDSQTEFIVRYEEFSYEGEAVISLDRIMVPGNYKINLYDYLNEWILDRLNDFIRERKVEKFSIPEGIPF